jgi:Cdc6-like AAA superfamily ATPase
MVFPPYTHKQIKEILESRLGEVGISFFMQSSLEMLSRKASSITGDLRGALKICQRAIELHLERKKEKDATNQQEMDATHQFSTSNSSTSSGRQFIAFDIILQAVNEYSQSPMMMFMRHSCLLDRRLLAVICKHCLVCGCNTISVDMIWRRLETFHNLVLSQIGDLQPPLLFPTTQQFYTAVERLEDTGLINIANKYRRNGSASISPVGEVSLVAELMDVVCAIKDTSRLYLEVLIKL